LSCILLSSLTFEIPKQLVFIYLLNPKVVACHVRLRQARVGMLLTGYTIAQTDGRKSRFQNPVNILIKFVVQARPSGGISQINAEANNAAPNVSYTSTAMYKAR
jgi:hypothetical protein